MSGSKALGTYEAILGITTEMLDAARRRDWERLIMLEQFCKRLVEGLPDADSDEAQPHGIARRKSEIIRKVLAHDAEIRSITESWMDQLQELLGNVGREKRLHEAYVSGTAVYALPPGL